jgi:piRNA pathway germ-plasm component
MSCYFHYWADKNQYCSLTNAKRWAFIMSENLLPLFRLPFISGRHCPEKEEYTGIKESEVQCSFGVLGFENILSHFDLFPSFCAHLLCLVP